MRVPTGRFERRVAKTEIVELLLSFGELPTSKVEAVTENVSPGGARVITSLSCAPGKLVRLDAFEEHLNLPARVVYCQRLEESVKERKFALGLRLEVRVKEWQKPR